MKRMVRVIMVGILAVAAALVPSMADESGHVAEQTLCPVMEGNPIKESIDVDYQGERVYFCCEFCKGEFSKQPDKYLAKLPQFTASRSVVEETAPAHAEGPAAEKESGWRLYRFTGSLGIATFSLLFLTFCTGSLRRKLKRRFLKIHKPLAFAAVAVAILHALTVLLSH